MFFHDSLITVDCTNHDQINAGDIMPKIIFCHDLLIIVNYKNQG